MIKIAIADDHSLFRRGLISLLSEIMDFQISFEVDNGMELLENLEQNPVDIVLLDLQMPILSGFQVIEVLNKIHPHIKIIAISFNEGLIELQERKDLNVSGVYNKSDNPNELVQLIQTLQTPINQYKYSVYKDMISIDDYLDIDISEREKEIIRLHALEYSAKEVAEILNISPRTIEVHKKNLMKRIGAKNFIGVILYAFQNNLI